MAVASVLEVLLLLLVANGAPILAGRLLPGFLARPLDGGALWRDGRPLLGPRKTWRGLLAALAATAAASLLLGEGWLPGLAAAAAAMAGDGLSSFVKRRLNVAPSDPAVALDQVPEAVLPALVLKPLLGVGYFEVAAGAFLFVALGVPISVVLFRLGVRKRPY